MNTTTVTETTVHQRDTTAEQAFATLTGNRVDGNVATQNIDREAFDAFKRLTEDPSMTAEEKVSAIRSQFPYLNGSDQGQALIQYTFEQNSFLKTTTKTTETTESPLVPLEGFPVRTELESGAQDSGSIDPTLQGVLDGRLEISGVLNQNLGANGSVQLVNRVTRYGELPFVEFRDVSDRPNNLFNLNPLLANGPLTADQFISEVDRTGLGLTEAEKQNIRDAFNDLPDPGKSGDPYEMQFILKEAVQGDIIFVSYNDSTGHKGIAPVRLTAVSPELITTVSEEVMEQTFSTLEALNASIAWRTTTAGTEAGTAYAEDLFRTIRALSTGRNVAFSAAVDAGYGAATGSGYGTRTDRGPGVVGEVAVAVAPIRGENGALVFTAGGNMYAASPISLHTGDWSANVNALAVRNLGNNAQVYAGLQGNFHSGVEIGLAPSETVVYVNGKAIGSYASDRGTISVDMAQLAVVTGASVDIGKLNASIQLSREVAGVVFAGGDEEIDWSPSTSGRVDLGVEVLNGLNLGVYGEGAITDGSSGGSHGHAGVNISFRTPDLTADTTSGIGNVAGFTVVAPEVNHTRLEGVSTALNPVDLSNQRGQKVITNSNQHPLFTNVGIIERFQLVPGSAELNTQVVTSYVHSIAPAPDSISEDANPPGYVLINSPVRLSDEQLESLADSLDLPRLNWQSQIGDDEFTMESQVEVVRVALKEMGVSDAEVYFDMKDAQASADVLAEANLQPQKDAVTASNEQIEGIIANSALSGEAKLAALINAGIEVKRSPDSGLVWFTFGQGETANSAGLTVKVTNQNVLGAMRESTNNPLWNQQIEVLTDSSGGSIWQSVNPDSVIPGFEELTYRQFLTQFPREAFTAQPGANGVGGSYFLEQEGITEFNGVPASQVPPLTRASLTQGTTFQFQGPLSPGAGERQLPRRGETQILGN